MSHFVFALCIHPLMANSLFIKATHRFTKKGKHHISFCPPYINRRENENTKESYYGYTTFKKIPGKDFYPGMLIREIEGNK